MLIYRSLSRVGILLLMSIFLVLSGCSSGGGGSSDVRLSGIVSDPFISSARVWCDVNDNGYFDDADKSTLSDSAGAFTFSGNDCVDEVIIVDGLADTTHVDESGNVISSFTGRMKAPSGSAFVSPLTSLQQTIIESDTSDDNAATKKANASAKVAKALGLVDETTGEALVLDFSTLDINAANQKGAQKAAIVAQQLLLDTTAAMQGTTGEPMTPSSFEAVTKALAKAMSTATLPIIRQDGGLDPVVVRQAVQSTIESVVKDVPDYADFDAASIVGAIGDAVVVNTQQAATIVDESGTGAITAAKLTQSQGSGSELIRVTMDSIKSYVNGSGDFDGDGEADIGQGVKTAAEVFEELANVLAAISVGLAEAVSSDMQGATTDTTLSAGASRALIANVIQQTVGAALESRGLGSIASRVVQNVDTAIVNGDTTKFVDSDTNNAPVARDRTLTLRNGESKTVKFRARDIDAGDTLTFALVDSPAGVTLGENGAFTFDANISGIDAGSHTFEFTVSDGTASDTGMVKVTVLGGNLAPIAHDREIKMRLGETSQGRFPVMNFDGDALTFSLPVNPSSIASVVDNQFLLDTSADGFAAGSYTVTYLVDDGNGGTDTGDIVIDVLGLTANNPPIAFNGFLTLKLGQTGNGQLRAADPDVGDTLTYSNVTGDSGDLTLTPSTGEFEFSTTGLSVGVYIVKYSVSDGTDAREAAVKIVITSVVAEGEVANTAPFARNSNMKILTGGDVKSGTLLGFDLEGGDLTFTKETDPTEGSVVVSSNGAFTYTPSTVAGIYSFDFKVTDAAGASAMATVTIDVILANRPPIGISLAIVIDLATTTGTTYSGVFQALDDALADGVESLTYTIESNAGGRAVLTSAGSSDGGFTFTYDRADDIGRHEIVFNVYDGTSFGQGRVIVKIVNSTASNSAPVAIDGGMKVTQGTTGSGNLGAFDPDSADTLTYLITSNAGGLAALTGTGAADGSFTFNATSNVTPGLYKVEFSVTDVGGLSSTGEVTVGVLAAAGTNNPPIARDGRMGMDADTVKQGRFVAFDADDDALTYAITNNGGLTVTLQNASTGAFGVNGEGAKGPYTITFSVTDGNATDTGMVEVNVRSLNSPPVAGSTSLTLVSGETKTGVTLGGSDTDGGDTLTYAKQTNPTAGVVTVDASAGTYTFNATDVAAGVYTFAYSVSDNVASSVGTVTVTVTAANNPPTAAAGEVEVMTGESESGALGGADLDGADTLTYTLVSETTTNAVTVSPSGNVTFNAAGVAVGEYSFVYQVSDGTASATATVTVTVTAVANNAPTAGSGILKGLSGEEFTGVLAGADTDGGILTFAITSTTGTGATGDEASVTGVNNGNFMFNATDVADGVYTVSYTVTDPLGALAAGTVEVTVGSFLQVSGIKVGNTSYTVSSFETSGANITVPLTMFGFNLEAKGSVATDMTVKLGLSMASTSDTRTIKVVVNSGSLNLLSNGELVITVPAAAITQISYFNGSTTNTFDVTNAGEDIISTTPAGSATSLTFNVNSILSRVNADESITSNAGGTLTSSLTSGVFTTTAVISVLDASNNVVNIKDSNDTDLTESQTVTSDTGVGGQTVTGQGVNGTVTISDAP